MQISAEIALTDTCLNTDLFRNEKLEESISETNKII